MIIDTYLVIIYMLALLSCFIYIGNVSWFLKKNRENNQHIIDGYKKLFERSRDHNNKIMQDFSNIISMIKNDVGEQ